MKSQLVSILGFKGHIQFLLHILFLKNLLKMLKKKTFLAHGQYKNGQLVEPSLEGCRSWECTYCCIFISFESLVSLLWDNLNNFEESIILSVVLGTESCRYMRYVLEYTTHSGYTGWWHRLWSTLPCAKDFLSWKSFTHCWVFFNWGIFDN